MDLVDEGFDDIFIFCGVRWPPLSENNFLKIGDVALEAWFLRGVRVPVLVSGSAPAGASPSLLFHFSFILHGDVIAFFCNNVVTTAVP